MLHLVLILLLLIGLLFMAAGGYGFVSSLRLTRTGLRAEAEVVDLRVHRRDNGRIYYPVLRFLAADGREVVAVARSGSNPAPARTGDLVRVVYQPGNPQSVALDTVMGSGMVVTALVFIMGLGLVAAGAYLTTR